MPDAPDPWQQIRRRIEQLPPERQAVVALASAEHLVALAASTGQEELRRFLALGWAALRTGHPDLSRSLATLSLVEESASLATAIERLRPPQP